MYLSTVTLENFRRFGGGTNRLVLPLRPGLTALVGENDAGKTAVVDALRFALGTMDQEWYRLEGTDLHGEEPCQETRIVCHFERLNALDKRAFVEYLTYGKAADGEPVLYVNWTARDTGEVSRGRAYRRVEVHSGKDGDGPSMAPEVRDLLRATYLRPLRDAEQALSAGRGSRLAQVLRQSERIKNGQSAYVPTALLKEQELSVLAIADLVNALLEKQQGILATRSEIDKNLRGLSLHGELLKSNIKVSGVSAPNDVRLRELLEKLDLRLGGAGKLGLGSNNLLFMACELLLLAQEDEGNKLLLIEEPEAHLHTQRQLRVMKFMQERAEEKGIQIIVTTHSPNLASAIELDNMVMISDGHAFSMARGQTELEPSDYRFLKRFLDVTKANLFFARGVMIVEGDGENILLPALANLLDRDFTERGVSIVNVGGLGLHRYARIFQRRDTEKDGQLKIPVACVTDMDVMPDCAPMIVGKLDQGDAWPPTNTRRWRAKKDIGDERALVTYRDKKRARASGQYVKTFISDEWTFEYSLALGPKDEEGKCSSGLADDVFVAASLADRDDAINSKEMTVAEVEAIAVEEFASLKAAMILKDSCTVEEVLASNIYAKFTRDGVSKAIAAQYLVERLQSKRGRGELTPNDLRKRLPRYLTEAIDYVTRAEEPMLNRGQTASE